MATPGKTPFRSLPLVQREVALLVVLSIAAALTFTGTRSLAAWSRRTTQEAGAAWFAQSTALGQAGRLDASIDALRQAVASDHDNLSYELALARALVTAHQDDEAQRLLLRLRESQPEDIDINYRLARLAAASGDTTAAERYYNNALYGVPARGETFDRSAIRMELAALELGTGDREAGASEVAALARDLPESAAAYLAAGRLARQAGEPQRAVTFFQHALRLEPTSVAAALGVGTAAMEANDPATAVKAFERALKLGADPESTQAQLDAAEAAVKARDAKGGQ